MPARNQARGFPRSGRAIRSCLLYTSVRVGYNAPEIEDAFPYVTLAKELGLKVCLNFMKTYGVSAELFGEKARAAAAAGAGIIYCVDSAGSMFPEDVRRYLTAARELCNVTLGFHGHSNLCLLYTSRCV